jgi:hypothetical protein
LPIRYEIEPPLFNYGNLNQHRQKNAETDYSNLGKFRGLIEKFSHSKSLTGILLYFLAIEQLRGLTVRKIFSLKNVVSPTLPGKLPLAMEHIK